jgi:hypothetical protein
MALPIAKAKSLADTMQKHGLVGSISMGKPMGKPPEADDEEPSDPSDDEAEDKSEMEHCLAEAADAISSGDKAKMVSALRDLIDCVKEEDDSSEGE